LQVNISETKQVIEMILSEKQTSAIPELIGLVYTRLCVMVEIM